MLYDEDEIRHYIKNAMVVEPFGKEGSIGIFTMPVWRSQDQVRMQNKRISTGHNNSGGILMSMTKCPICGTPLVWEDKEIKKGIYARVQVCNKCQEHYIDLKDHERVYREYYSKTFKSGNSIAIIIPKKVADEAGFKVGTPFKINVKDGKIVIEAVA